MVPITFETNGVKSRAKSYFAVWKNRLLCEQTNENALEGEATLRMAWNITAIGVSEHFEQEYQPGSCGNGKDILQKVDI